MVLENFKSYAGRVYVGPFKKFTCVVGPNGAGKSNLMDAISFVLGVRPRHLRSERLQELIYTKEGASAPIAREASVELVYVGSAPGPEGDDHDGAELAEVRHVFRRAITSESREYFQVDGQAVLEADYMQQLKSINILSQARNFVVFQGDLELAAHRHGKDLTSYFEQVSGSAEFRPEYERLAKLKTQREDDARGLYIRKRNAMNEKKRLAAQKEEVDKFMEMETEYKETQVEFYLFQFHCNAWQREDLNRQRVQVTQKQRELGQHLLEREQRLQTAQTEREQAHLTVTEAERSVAAMRAQSEGASPESVKVSTELEMAKLELKKLKTNCVREARKQQELNSQLAELRSKEERLASDQKKLADQARREPDWKENQREEFEEAKRMAEKCASESSHKIRDVENRIRAVATERARVDSEQREACARGHNLRRRVAELTDSVQEASAAQEQAAALARECSERLRERQDDGRDQRRREELRARRQTMMQGVQNITATAQQLENERRLEQTTADLAQLEPGVLGRVCDLCRPSHQRMRVAVNVALGGYVDAVITETMAGARRCVRHLKERMLGSFTFLPQDDLRGPAPDYRLEEAVRDKPTMRMALSCVTFDERHRRACEFLLGNVVIADNLADGRQFVFGELRAKRLTCKLVTVDGELISADGNVAVNSEAARVGSTRFDFSAMEKTRVELEKIDRELCMLRSRRDGDQIALQEEAKRREARDRESRLTLQRLQDELAARQEDMRRVDAAVEALKPQSDRLAEDESQLRREQTDLEESIGQSVSTYFARLSTAMGVDDIRKHERKLREEREAAQRSEREVAQELGAIRAEISIVDQNLRELASRDPQGAAGECEAEVTALGKKQEKVGRDKRAVDGELANLKAQLQQVSEVEREKENVAARCRREVQEEQQRLAEVEKQLTNINSEMRILTDAHRDLLRRSVLDDVDIPLTSRAAGGREALTDVAAAVAAEPGQQDPAAALSVDLARLPEEKRAVTSGAAAKMLIDEYREELRRINGELERLQPNMKVTEQLAAAQEQADEATKEAMDARKKIEDVEAQFEITRKARRERFMECFQKVADEISTIYKKLTACSMRPGRDGGGAAYLDLEDLEDPFAGGVKFTAMPPLKRFCDISLLSGGEKTLAAMALLFAIQAFQHPPFLILDEVDAYLDTGNLGALASYVEQDKGQIIVISLKDKFFSRCEGLVGVSRNRQSESSMTLTMDLARLRRGQPPASDAPPLAAPPLAPAAPLAPPVLSPPIAEGELARGES